MEDGGEAGATGGKLGGAVYAADREAKPQKADKVSYTCSELTFGLGVAGLLGR